MKKCLFELGIPQIVTMEGKYVRPLNYLLDDDDSDENGMDLEDKDTTDKASDDITSNFGKINPLALVDAFPDNPGLEEAREYWIDWIDMLNKLFNWNKQVQKSENMKLSILMAKGGNYIRKILSAKWNGNRFDDAIESINDYFKTNSNPLADEAKFRRIVQEKSETFERFADRVKKKAKVFGINDEKRVIAQITNGAVESEKLTDYSIRGDVGLAAIVAYGNQIEALSSTRDTAILPKEINELSTRQENRYRPYRVEREQREFGTKTKLCTYCGSSHMAGRCPYKAK